MRPSDPLSSLRYWTVIRKETNEPIFPDPVSTKHMATLLARGRLRMTMGREEPGKERTFIMRTDAQVDALIARDYQYRQYKLVETRS
jgi:hypothetical protein